MKLQFDTQMSKKVQLKTLHKINVLQFWPIITRTELQQSRVIKSSCLGWQAVNNLLKSEMQVWDFELMNWKQGIGEYAPISIDKIEQWE